MAYIISLATKVLEHAESFTVEIQPEESDLLALYRQKTLVESVDFDEDKQHYILKGHRRKLEE